MSKTNQRLAVVVLVLLAASIFTYHRSTSQGQRFERGRKLLLNLNPDEVASVKVSHGKETVTLERQGDHFLLREKDGYRAKNEQVNRLLKDLLEVALEKEAGQGAKLAEAYEIEPPGEETVDVSLGNAAGKEMVHLRFGKELEGGGVYVQRLDQKDAKIYLTQGRPSLSTDPASYLDKQIVDVAESKISRIEGGDFVVEEVFEEAPPTTPATTPEGAGEGEEAASSAAAPSPAPVSLGLHLAEVPAGQKVKTSALNQIKGALSRLEYEEVFPADAAEVAGLAFQLSLQVDLKDTSGYHLSLAQADGKSYLRIEGFSTVDRIEITKDEAEEDLKAKADTLTRADEIQDFNAFHGSWVYRIADRFAEKLRLTRADLLEKG